MEIIKAYFVIEDDIDGEKILKNLERYGRVCYKSEEKITSDSAKGFIKRALERGHESIIEHEKITVRVISDRGVVFEIVRHRLGSYSQESTRYCNYKFRGMTVIEPFFFEKGSEKYEVWKKAMENAEGSYDALIGLGATPEQARTVVPDSLKAELVMTYNIREWRHFFKVRCSQRAHPQMREISVPLLREFQKRMPVLFDDIVVK